MKTYEDGQYLVVEDVPILDEHTLRDDDGNPVMRVSAKMLREIAHSNNKRFAATGDECPVVIGHTKDGLPEDKQPPIVGYASNFRVKRLLRTTRQAIHATFKFFKDKLDVVRQFPRRSVEFWLSDKKIDPIALLGATTPERDLGLLRLERGGSKARRIMNHPLKLENKSMPFPPNPSSQPPTNASSEGQRQNPIVDQVLAAIQQTDAWKFLEQMMHDAAAADAPDGDVMADDVGLDDGMDDYDDLGGADDFGGDEPPPDDDDDEDPARYSAGYGSGSNTFVPSFPRRRDMNRSRFSRPRRGVRPTPSDNLKLRRAQEQQSIQLARTQRALFSTAQQLEDLKLQYRKSEREKDLIQLEAEGYIFDRAEELEAVAGLNDSQYRAHLGRIRKRYSRAPVGGDWIGGGHSRLPSPPGGTPDKATMQKIIDFASERGISYDQAKAELTGESDY